MIEKRRKGRIERACGLTAGAHSRRVANDGARGGVRSRKLNLADVRSVDEFRILRGYARLANNFTAVSAAIVAGQTPVVVPFELVGWMRTDSSIPPRAGQPLLFPLLA